MTATGMTDDRANRSLRRTVCARIPTAAGECLLCHYENEFDRKEHLAIVFGDVRDGRNVKVRVHSECFTGDVLGSRRCDCGPQLQRAMELIAEAGSGVVVYLRQEGRGIGLEQKLRAYNLQDAGYDTVDANLLLGHQADERDYWAAAGILADLGVHSVNLLTNNPAKIERLRELGIDVAERTPLIAGVTNENRAYLAAKVERMRHILDLPDAPSADRFEPELQARLDHLLRRVTPASSGSERPFVTLTWAQSLNGVIAGPKRERIRLSSDGALRMTHALRTLHQGILVGIGTILADDPLLSARLVDGPSPRPVILDARLRTPLDARIWRNPKPPIIAAHNPAPARAAPLIERGAAILDVPLDEAGRLDLHVLLHLLHSLGITSLMVEGGAQVIGDFLRRRLVDQVVITISPRFETGIGAVAAAGDVAPLPVGASLPSLTHVTWSTVDNDLIVWGELVQEPLPERAVAPAT